jgi:branched-chain amino acid transport system substrate-binding protein
MGFGTVGLGRRGLLAGAAALSTARARAAGKPVIRIGVLSDMTGPYADSSGPGCVLGAQMAAEDAMRDFPDTTVEIIVGDMENKPDVGVGIARRWFDRENVAAIVDVPQSAVALAITGLAREKNRVGLFSSAGSSELTGRACGPNHIHWTHDSYGIPSAVTKAVIRAGGDSWFFITPNYAFGAALEHDSRQFVLTAGAKVLGSVTYPFPETSDFSSFLLQAQASGAKVIGLAMSGQDVVNCVKQAMEFGIDRKTQTFAGLAILITTIHAVGLDAAQGMLLAVPFYWDLNDGTREFSTRFRARNKGVVPTMNHAGAYAAVNHYLKAVRALGADTAATDGAATVLQMKAIPTDDPLFGKGEVRIDGRVIHDMHLFRVKTPAESKGSWDYYTHIGTVPGAEAFRPLHDGGCALVKF